MADKKTKKRNEIDKKYKWNIEEMYPDEKDWDKDYSKVLEMAESYSAFSGRLGESAQTLYKAFSEKDAIWMKLERVYVYARMRRDEDNACEKYQAMCDKCNPLIAKTQAALAFFTPQLLEIPEEKLLGFLDEYEPLSVYRFAITDTLRGRKHVLSPSEEALLAQLGEVLGATNDIFTMLNNADMKFGEITDEDGEKVTLTHGNYINFMESHKRSVRKEAFEHMYGSYKALINTIATTYNYNTRLDAVSAGIRKYESARAAALYGDNIPASVYDNLVAEVNKALPVLHRYLKKRKELLGVSELHMYDVYVPLIELPKQEVSFEEAVEIMKKGLAPMGSDYLARLSKGVSDGWIDVYENEGKTSGAYSFGSYDSMPYVLLNFTGQLKDVFTIVHEMGHSMHSDYTREAQPYIYGSHSIFTAEVASTVNESLLMKYLIANADSDEMKKYLVNMYIEEFRTTLFRQTMFAEFEDLTHKAIESGEVLTAAWLNKTYLDLNKKYFGDDVVSDDEIAYEWSRIPHFYNAFYVYKYATGYSAATAISKKILEEGEPARNAYIEFLKTGESDYPIELLKIAGVDMGSPEPVKLAMKTFEELVDEFDALTRG
ncbi:MAG: oligoendopeptidase F [Clostridia bacterium]|nr:oligoendopeptidase F [Clostridia bacterium]